MELSFREWMIIVGVLLIVAVLLDGYRRVRNERRHRIKVSLSRSAYKQAFAPSATDDIPDERSSPNPELPGGGARIRWRRSGDNLNLDQPVPVLLDSVDMPDPEPEPEPEPEPWVEPRAQAEASFDEHSALDQPEPDWDDTPWHEPEQLPEAQSEPEPEPALQEPVRQRPAARAEPAYEPEPEPEEQAWEPVGHGEREGAPAREVLVIYVLARDKAAGFKGQDLLQLLLACDLRFGDMNIFHRYEKANGRGAVQFSVANLMEPGTFNLDRMEEFSTPGVCLFLPLPGPEAPYKAFDYMVETANVLVKHLNGEMRDEAHSVMTQQTLEHCRQRIRDFERRQLTLHL